MAENSDNIASIEAARAAASQRADKLHGASEDLIAAEGRRVDAEIEATARLLCTAAGVDPDAVNVAPDEWDVELDRPLPKRWEDWIDDARMMLSPPGNYIGVGNDDPSKEEWVRLGDQDRELTEMEKAELARGIAITRVGADGVSERISPEDFFTAPPRGDPPYFFPGEKDEPTGIAPESLEQMHEADVETALIQRALTAEDCVRRVEADLQMEQARFDALERQLTFALAALTRQFERVAGLRLFCGDMRAEQVVPFVQAEVDAVNATLTAIENRRVVS